MIIDAPEWSSICGHPGADPQVRRTQDGRPIANLRWQHQNRGATEIGRGHEKTEWHRVVIFTEGLAKDRRAVFAQRFEGILEGAWQTREWMDNLGLVLQGYSANITTLFDRHEGNGDSRVTTISALGMIDPRTNRQRFPRTVVQ